MDVKSTFLNGVLKEEVYVEHPPSYEVAGEEKKVYRLKRPLYGLKKAPRAWYSRIDSYLMSNGFNKSNSEPTLYIKVANRNVLIVVLYVDDLILTGNNKALIGELKKAIKNEVEMTNLGLLKYFLGTEVKKMHDGIFISQEKYARRILDRFKIQNSKPTPIPTAIGLKLSKEDSSKSESTTIKEYGWKFDAFECNSARIDACSMSDFQIYENTKGFPSASGKEDPKVSERYQGIWNFVY